MRHVVCSVLLGCLVVLPLLAQSEPGSWDEEKPQLAFHLFSNWVDNYMAGARRGKVVGSTILFGTGTLCAAGAVVTWTAGDDIAKNVSGSPLSRDVKGGLTLGLGIGAAALCASGILTAALPIKDYRSIYSDIYQEQDPEVREAMAVSVLRNMAEQGREGRISSSIVGLLAPLLAASVASGFGARSFDEWGQGMLRNCAGMSWCLVGSAVSLFTKSSEERLYERYVAARDAYYETRK